jgi:hypothetical protein
MSTAIVVGSLADVATRNGQDIAESFVNADAVIICDVSGSMMDRDSRGGKSRYDVALDELATLQRSMPGKLAVIAFSGETLFVPGGAPPMLGGGTDVAGALKFAKMADVPGMRFFLISDGEPDSARDALDVAKTFKAHIDTIYVGSEARPTGREFLRKLAAATGGQTATADCVKELATVTTKLLRA